MSSPQLPPETPVDLKWGRLDTILAILLASAFVVPILWLSWVRLVRDVSADRSIVIEGQFQNSGHIMEHGRIYSQAEVDLPPGTDLVLPANRGELPPGYVQPTITVEVRPGGEPDTVRILVEQHVSDSGHYGRPIYLREWGRAGMWKRQVGSVLTVDVNPGSAHIHGGTRVRVIFIVPLGQNVRQAPPTSPEFASRYKDGWPMPDDEQMAAGWERVPVQPLSHKLFR